MFQNIEEYIKKDISERILHLDLQDRCLEIGGYDSREYRGLLAHYLLTTIPTGKKILLCHKCGNSKCSNVKHIYWGTYKENITDSIEHGTYKNPHISTIEKYGKDIYKDIMSSSGAKGGKKGGGKNKISNEKIEDFKNILINSDPEKYGWIKRVSDKTGLSHTRVRKIANMYCKDIFCHKRN